MSTILKAVNIQKTYGKGELSVHALKNINLSIEDGIFYAIIGKSGSGKSTLLHILGGLDKPSSGKMYLEDKSMFDLRDRELAILRRQRIGFVFQSFNLLEEHTVMENILMPIELDGKHPDMKHIDKVIDSLGIREKLSYYPDELSGGQRQRVAIARALASKPALLLADEPTGNLDEKNAQMVFSLFEKLVKEDKIAVVIVTHDNSLSEKCDRVYTMKDGIIHE